MNISRKKIIVMAAGLAVACLVGYATLSPAARQTSPESAPARMETHVSDARPDSPDAMNPAIPASGTIKATQKNEGMVCEEKQTIIQKTMASLERSRDKTVREKLAIFIQALHQTYGNETGPDILKLKFSAAKIFFSIHSVQDDLTPLDPEKRQLEIDHVRRELGFTPDMIEQASAIDAKKDRRWETGFSGKRFYRNTRARNEKKNFLP
jgi:hypothetical protein